MALPRRAPAHEDPTELIDRTLAGVDLRRLEDEVRGRLRRRGVTFGSGGDFRVDPVPRVITADDWAPLAAGLIQRVRALNRFVADVYGDQRIVAAGVVPAAAIETAEYFEPQLRGAGLAAGDVDPARRTRRDTRHRRGVQGARGQRAHTVGAGLRAGRPRRR